MSRLHWQQRPRSLRRLRGRWPLLMAAALAAVMAACEKVENSIYRDYPAYFIFDTSLHPMPCHLTSAMGNSGHFLIVETRMAGGVRHIVTTRNYDQATEDVTLTTQKENNTRCLLGAGGAIVIGRSSYTGLMMAYERQCPNCLDRYGGSGHPLTWSANGERLDCHSCQRSYDVHNGVVAAGEGGRQLYTYNAAFDGTLIRVWN